MLRHVQEVETRMREIMGTIAGSITANIERSPDGKLALVACLIVLDQLEEAVHRAIKDSIAEAKRKIEVMIEAKGGRD